MLQAIFGKEFNCMNIDKSDISVIIPAYNCQNTILKTIDSINHQIENDYIYEIIIVNDGSTDETRSIIEKVLVNNPIRIRLINSKNGGVSKARNIGMNAAHTKWIALCDSDDEWLVDKIKRQANLINLNNDIDFLGGNHLSKTQRFLLKRISKLTKISTIFLCFKILPQTSTVVFKRSIFESIGGYDETQKHAEDGNFFMKIAANFGVYYDPGQVVFFGSGKHEYGESGLSSNVRAMHLGLLKNLYEMNRLGYISTTIMHISICFEYIKYMVRLIKLKFRK